MNGVCTRNQTIAAIDTVADNSGRITSIMGKPGETGLTRIIHAAGYSYRGMIAAFRHEAAFRQEALLALILCPLAVYIGDTSFEISVLIASVVLVLIVELLNSAIEAVVDRIGPEHHELSGRAKDLGSAAVFLSLTCLFIVWLGVILN